MLRVYIYIHIYVYIYIYIYIRAPSRPRPSPSADVRGVPPRRLGRDLEAEAGGDHDDVPRPEVLWVGLGLWVKIWLWVRIGLWTGRPLRARPQRARKRDLRKEQATWTPTRGSAASFAITDFTCWLLFVSLTCLSSLEHATLGTSPRELYTAQPSPQASDEEEPVASPAQPRPVGTDNFTLAS